MARIRRDIRRRWLRGRGFQKVGGGFMQRTNRRGTTSRTPCRTLSSRKPQERSEKFVSLVYIDEGETYIIWSPDSRIRLNRQ